MRVAVELDGVPVGLFHLAEIPLNSSSALPRADDSFQFGVTCKPDGVCSSLLYPEFSVQQRKKESF